MLRPLITPNNTIAAFPNGNALVITDYADNLRRIDRIIATLDQPPQGEPVLIPVRHASARRPGRDARPASSASRRPPAAPPPTRSSG